MDWRDIKTSFIKQTIIASEQLHAPNLEGLSTYISPFIEAIKLDNEISLA